MVTAKSWAITGLVVRYWYYIKPVNHFFYNDLSLKFLLFFLLAEEVGLDCLHLEGTKTSFFYEVRPGSYSLERLSRSLPLACHYNQIYYHSLISTVLFLYVVVL